MSGFWGFLASVRDDVRHKVVEEPWFGKQVTDLPTATNTTTPASAQPETKTPQEETRHSLYEQTWGKAATHAEVYGQGPSPASAQPEAETPKEPDARQSEGHGPEL